MISSSASTIWHADDREIAAPAFLALEAVRKLVNLRIYLVTRYERLFIGGFGLGNEGRMGESVVANRLRLIGSALPVPSFHPIRCCRAISTDIRH